MLPKTISSYLSTTKFAVKGDAKQIIDAITLVHGRTHTLISLDIEAWEHDPKRITELGISVYDPKKSSLFPAIETTHLIVKENLERCSGRFVPNHKHNYNGKHSFILPEKECAKFVKQTLSAHDQYALVGQSFSGDAEWLRSLGVDIPKSTPLVDLCKLYFQLRKNGGNLHGVLDFLDIPHSNLHNAANDAYYTMVATMLITDPGVRIRHGLDTYVENEPQGNKKERKKLMFRKSTPSTTVMTADDVISINSGEVVPQMDEVVDGGKHGAKRSSSEYGGGGKRGKNWGLRY